MTLEEERNEEWKPGVQKNGRNNNLFYTFSFNTIVVSLPVALPCHLFCYSVFVCFAPPLCTLTVVGIEEFASYAFRMKHELSYNNLRSSYIRLKRIWCLGPFTDRSQWLVIRNISASYIRKTFTPIIKEARLFIIKVLFFSKIYYNSFFQ